MPKSTSRLPEWEQVLSSAAHLQEILPDAVLVGGTAAALYAEHRQSMDADHVLTGLKEHFDGVLAQLESIAGRKTANLAEYKNLVPKWHEWASVRSACSNCAVLIFDGILGRDDKQLSQ